MAKLINNTNSIGPYPGRTWEEEAEAVGDSPFAFSVIRQIDRGRCDNCHCGEPIDEHYHFCSEECYEFFNDECRREAEWEARVS